MATKLDYSKLPIASPRNKTRHDLSHRHLTTSAFCEMLPTLVSEIVPNTSVNFKVSPFVRLLPMPSPAYTSIKVSNRQFFVPMRTIFPKWNEFITDSANVSGSQPKVKTITDYELAKFFYDHKELLDTKNKITFPTSSTSDQINADVIIANGTTWNVTEGKPIGYNFTPFGARVMKFLNSIGYVFGFSYYGANPDGSGVPTDNLTTFSFLPFMAVVKVYIDYYHPAQFLNNSVISEFNSFINDPVFTPVEFLEKTGLELFKELRSLSYDHDYYTSAWQQPNAPSRGDFSTISLNVVQPQFYTTQSGVQKVESNINPTGGQAAGTPILITSGGEGGTPPQLTDYGLRVLKKLTDYMARNQFVGSRAVDRYLARYGVRLDFSKFNRAQFIDSNEFTINIGDVTSTADTTQASLGSYAGKGIGFNEGQNISFETDEFGYYINITTIMPRVAYFQQYDRMTKHVNRFDFWTPEFDGLGTQAITCAELFSGNALGCWIDGPSTTTRVFGWQPRYAEYKMSKDIVTGQFVRGSLPEYDSWATTRNMLRANLTAPFQYQDEPIDESFVKTDDFQQYNKIFYSMDDDDKFLIALDFEMIVHAPFKDLYDIHEYNDEHQGEERALPISGTTLN